MRYILGLLCIGVGYLMIVYAQRFREIIGNIGWAEKAFGMGGTDTGIKLMGVGVIMLSFMYMTNTLDFLLKATLFKFIFPGQNF